MKVNIEFDLNNEEDRKMYSAYRNMRDITLNLEKLKEMLILHTYDKWEPIRIIEEQNNRFDKINSFFEEMIWKKLA